MEMKEIMKELGSRISNIGTIVDTNPDNDPVEEYSDKNLKDIAKTNNNTTDAIFKQAYEKLNNIIFKYNNKGQELGENDKLRAGITAQSLQGSILESTVMEDPATGYKMVDTRHLALANAGAIKILFEKIDELEKLIKK